MKKLTLNKKKVVSLLDSQLESLQGGGTVTSTHSSGPPLTSRCTDTCTPTK